MTKYDNNKQLIDAFQIIKSKADGYDNVKIKLYTDKRDGGKKYKFTLYVEEDKKHSDKHSKDKKKSKKKSYGCRNCH